MENEKEIKALLMSKAFKFSEKSNEWTTNDWTIRFSGREMEIYEDIDKGNKYLLTETDIKILGEILDEL